MQKGGKVRTVRRKSSSSYHNPKGITLLTKAQLGFRHLFDEKFKHGFLGKFLTYLLIYHSVSSSH